MNSCAEPAAPAPFSDVTLSAPALFQLLPLALLLGKAGQILAAGPLLRRIFQGQQVIGSDLIALFELHSAASLSLRAAQPGERAAQLRLMTRAPAPRLRLNGHALALPPGGDAVWLLNLSFGSDILRAVSLLSLQLKDFPPGDLTPELLCMAEANQLIRSELHNLGRRLDEARQEAEAEALTDPLTGLNNRRAADARLASLCRGPEPFALLLLDLDFFKEINDTQGHAAGDQVLRALASLLPETMRAGDMVARIGGDEFLALLPGLQHPARLDALARDILARISLGLPGLSASIGTLIRPALSATDHEGLEPPALLAELDAALYAAKAAGRNRFIRAGPGPGGMPLQISGADLQRAQPLV